MDLDPEGPDLTGESQFNVNPASGLDPTRQIRYVPTAATAIYPNVSQPITAPLASTDQVAPKTAVPLQIVPVVGQNVTAAPVDLQPPNVANLRNVAQQNPNLIMQTSQPQRPPGTGQGVLGSNITPVQPYDPQADSLETAKQNLRSRAERQEGFARNPLMQFFFKSQTDKANDEAVEKRMKVDEIERKQADDKAVQTQADNAGLRINPRGSEKLVVESVLQDYLSGDPVKAGRAAAMLTARGHGELVKGLEDQSAEAMKARFEQRQQIQDKLDTATTDQEYNDLRKQLDGQDAGFKIPPTRGQYAAEAGARKAAGQKALLMIQQHQTKLAEQSDYTPEPNEQLAKVNAGKATYYTGEPMHTTIGVKHSGYGTNGGQVPSGSHILSDYTKTWGSYDKAAQEEIQKRMDEAYPKTEREKNITVMRTIKLATTDPKTGKPMTDEDTQKLINTNPNVGQAVAEALATALRGGAGGANGQLIKLELAKRGMVQGAFDELMSAWAGGRGVVTGKEGQYLTKLTQGQIRYVLDFIKDYSTKDVSSRIGPAAERAGMYGAKLDQLPIEEELKDAVAARHAYGRDSQIEHMSRQYRVIGADNSTFVGTGKAAAAVPGAVRTPIPATLLPGKYPELFAPPPAATNAPQSSSSPPPGTSTPLPQPGGGGVPRVLPQPQPPPPDATVPQGMVREPYNPRAGQYGRIIPAPAAPAPAPAATGPRAGLLDTLSPISSAQATEGPNSPAYQQAQKDLNLTPQEKALYERHLTNLTGPGGVDHPNGARSTLYQSSVEHDGKTYNIPTVFNGKILPVDQAVEQVKKIGWDKFPSYKSPEEAESRYQAMHGYMDKDTGAYLAGKRGTAAAPAPVPPTVPTPQAPGGPGTGSRPPPAASAPQGTRGGGTFSQGAPSAGFPTAINGNPVARTVYGVAGQTAQNVTNNPVIANNSAIVATSSAQSESAFNPNEIHDGGRGHGLFGHNGDRLERMQQFAGVKVTGKPGDAIPANVQTSWYVREMSKAADDDPFIARTLRDPNASAEDLTRVQIRMERPQGYKGPGTEEQAHNWTGRLANTRALMAGGGDQPAATASAAPAAQPAALPYPNPKSPQEARANYAAGQRQTPQEAASYQAIKNEQARQATVSAANLAPALGGAAGATIGSVVPGVGTVGGGAIGGALGGGVKNYFTGAPEQQNVPGYLKAGAFGGAQGAVAGFPGMGVAATAARVGLSGAIPGFEKFMEGKSSAEIYDATTMGMVGGAVGEGFGRGLGAAGYGLWKVLGNGGKAELMSVAKTLATEQPKIADATGKLVANPTYDAAMARAKQLHQDPDNLAHAYNTTAQPVPPTKGEALVQRPGEVGQAQAGRELQAVQEEVGAAPKPAAATAPTFKHDPVSLVGTSDVPKKFEGDAIAARTTMNQKASDWGEVWSNVTKARTNLLTKEREAMRIEGPGRQEAMTAYRAMADKVRDQQVEIANKLMPPAQAKALIERLETASNDYRKAITAGGDDIVKAIAVGGKNGREARAAFDALAKNDPEAQNMMNQLLKLHLKGAAKEGSKYTGLGIAGYAAMHVPGVGPLITGGIGMHAGFKALQTFLTLKGAGATVKFGDLVKRMPPKFRVPTGASTVIGGQAGADLGVSLGAQ